MPISEEQTEFLAKKGIVGPFEELGSGNFGNVVRARKGDSLVALKFIETSPKIAKEPNALLKEVALLR